MTLKNDEDFDKIMNTEYSYPETSDPELQKKIYEKREFYYHKTPERPELTDYDDIQEYRDNICARNFTLHEHQTMLSNFINPDTPYKGVIIFHGLGSGKTCVGITIAEKFKPLVQKYNTKIIVLVGGPFIKENWKQQILTCTGETYLKQKDKSIYVNKADKIRNEKMAMIQAMQFYKFMSYKSFYKHVIGEKITDRQGEEKGKVTYRKTDEGEFERDIAVDRIYSLNNTVIIVDEAHNLTGNTYGDALKQIIKNSVNLKVVLMSGTPMKNLGSDIIELVNFLRPLDSQIEKDKVFDGNKGHLMDLKNGGLNYLKNMMRGYVSHVRGGDPLTFAKRVDKGKKSDGLLFTKVTRCEMLKFQSETYLKVIEENKEDTLDRKSEAVANFVFPGLSSDKKEITGYYAGEGLNLIKNQLRVNSELINKKLSKQLFGHENDRDLIQVNQDGRSISGKILRMPYLKHFSIKFYKALKKLKRLVWGKRGSSSAFIYSNLVRVGISLFHEVLIENGYLEYQEDANNYQITDSTVCYFCGRKHSEHGTKIKKDIDDGESDNESDNESSDESDDESDDETENNIKISDSSTEYEKTPSKEKMPSHPFIPATFITVTGKSNEESMDVIPEDKMNIIKNVFNHIDNKDGRIIKFILGSRVINEGVNLKNISEVHILDAYFNFGRVDQVVGRAIRHCSHYKLMNPKNIYPEVDVYKYVVGVDNALSSEEELYKKAELKYLLIKKIERGMKEIAMDCPLNMNANVFKEEVKQYERCGENGEIMCPAVCDYTKCSYKCDDVLLDTKYYDPNRKMYMNITKDKIDYTTFTHGLSRSEINFVKDKVKDMYLIGYMYTLDNIIEYVEDSYNEEKKDLFDKFFVYKALEELIPVTENDFNNFKDVINDKHNRSGYLIYINKYYIFQPFDQNEDVPMYYRTTVTKHVPQQLSLYNYLKNNTIFQQLQEVKGMNNGEEEEQEGDDNKVFYNFDDAMEYYDNREENQFVGFIDKELNRRKTKSSEEVKDVFKLREKRAKILEKKRATGIPSLKGAVCSTSKSKKYLDKVLKKLDIDGNKNDTRVDVCDKIEQKMLLYEKYGTDKEKNKLTYVMIPVDHPIYKFPYNLEDRVKHTMNKITEHLSIKITMGVKTIKKKEGPEKGYPSYIITINNKNKLKKDEEFFESLGAKTKGNDWEILIE
jgi:superfamily II DNA or RNA helicase